MHSLITFIAKDLIIISILALPWLFFTRPRAKRLDLVIFVILSALITVALVKLATTVHQDPRPFVSDGARAYFKSAHDNGFPSDHTVASAFVAFVVLRYNRKVGLALLVLSLLIGWSRVAGHVHHAQDIVGGLLISGISVAMAYYLLKLVASKPELPKA